jgi:alpha,alpha-trehalose phosphorylase
VIPDRHFPVDPWQVREVGLDPQLLAQSESLFALSNGHIGVRGNLDEGDPAGLPGSYLNSFYEVRPLPYAEAGYGFPETGQTLLNVTNGKLIRLLVDDEPFDLRYGRIVSHERILDLRSGLLCRTVEWAAPSGQRIRLRTTRLVSFAQRAMMAIRYEVEALESDARVVVQSELVANEQLPAQSGDPRVAALLEHPLSAVEHEGHQCRALLLHRTGASRLHIAAGMDHEIDAEHGFGHELAVHPDWARLSVNHHLQPGERLCLTKYVAYGWSSQRSVPALRDQVTAALIAAKHTGWQGLVDAQRTALDTFWDGADVEIDGAPAVQQAVRFALFHTFQAGIRAERRAIPAKGLTGSGYDGHAFWDTECFVLPVLTATVPHAAADALRWRAATLELARERAQTLHLRGAAFPWRTIRGQECSGYWPAGTAAFHVNADIAVAADRYVQWTGDGAFDREVALPLLVETARLWMSLGYHGDDGQFHLDGITGPDEYSAIANDNVFTNLMAGRNLSAAADCADRWPAQSAELEVTAHEMAAWRRAADAMAVPFDEQRQVHQQDAGFTERAVWDFEASAREDGYPLLLHAPYFDLYRKQVVKQADLMLAMHWCGEAFTAEQKARAFAYYEPLTVRDSSLSACTQAVLAAEVGQRELAADYLAEAALMDLHDLQHNTRNGLHIASLAGTWLAVVAGFGGMRDSGGRLSFRPQLPPGWQRLCFSVRWRGARLRVSVDERTVRYELGADAAAPVRIRHAERDLDLVPGAVTECPVELVEPLTERPTQPAGREPIRMSDLD